MNLDQMTEADFNSAHDSHFGGRSGQGPLRVIHIGDQVEGSFKHRDQYLPTTATYQDRSLSACTSDACSSGDKECPTKDACRLPADPPLTWQVRLLEWLTPQRFFIGYLMVLIWGWAAIHFAGQTS